MSAMSAGCILGRFMSEETYRLKSVESRMFAMETRLLLREPHQSTGVPKKNGNRDRVWAVKCVLSNEVSEEGMLDKAVVAVERMDESTLPSLNACRSLLKACVKTKAISEAKQLHAHFVSIGLASQGALIESVIDTLVKCGSLKDALEIFMKLPRKTTFSCTAVISGYVRVGQFQEAMKMYQQMQQEGVYPDRFTFVSLLKACGGLGDLKEGKRMHAEVMRYRCQSDLYVGAALVDMYFKCGSIVDAVYVFQTLVHRDVVSWTTIIGGCAREQPEQALKFYAEMKMGTVEPDARIFMSVIQASGSLAEREESVLLDGIYVKADSLQKGKVFLAEAERSHASDVFLLNTMVSMYAKCGSIVDAQYVFNSLSQRDLVSWNAMLAGYAQQDQGEKALQLYDQMRNKAIAPDDRTFVGVLQACCSVSEKEDSIPLDGHLVKVLSLSKGKEVFAEATFWGYGRNFFVCNMLVTMYAKCRSILDAQVVFESLPQRDIVSWNAMLAAYSQQEEGDRALHLYSQMQLEGIKADETTYLSVLKACSTTGALDVCVQTHHHIMESGCQPSLQLATSLIHAYGACGCMVGAQGVFDSLSQPDVVSWTALLAGHAQQGNHKACLLCYEKMCLAGLKPDGVTFLSLLSACNHAGMVDRALHYFTCMTETHGVSASIEHYVTMIDLVSRMGLLDKAEELLLGMPIQRNFAVWMCLLGACRYYGNVTVGRRAFECSVQLQPKQAAAYVLMSNIYAHAGMTDSAKEIEELRKRAGAWKEPGRSWIEHEQQVRTFLVGDCRFEQSEQIRAALEELNSRKAEAFG